MIDLQLYAKLAEVILRKEMNQNQFIFKAIGHVREALQTRLKE